MKKLFFYFLFFCLTNFAIAQWQQTNGPYGGDINCLVKSKSNIFAGTSIGLFRSTNNGTSWTAINTGLTNRDIRTLTVNDTNIFVGTYGEGMFLSTDSGENWHTVNTGLSSYALYVQSVSISGSHIYLSSYNDESYLSIDNGANWSLISNCQHITSITNSGNNIFRGIIGSGVFLSTDNCASWIPVNTGLTNLAVNSLTTIGTNIFAGTEGGGIFLSTNNGASWNAINTGLTSQSKYITVLASMGTTVFAGTSGGTYFSTNNGASWTSTGLNMGIYARCFAVIDTNIFAGALTGIFLSTDNGINWTVKNSGIANNPVYSFIASGTNLFAGAANDVFLSIDNGMNWTATGLNMGISSLAVCNNNIYAGTHNGVYESTNYGTSWIADTIGISNNVVNSIISNGTNIFAATIRWDDTWAYWFGEMYKSTNYGSNWSLINNGIYNSSLQYYPLQYSLTVNGTKVYLGTDDEMFCTTNNGANWTEMGLSGCGVIRSIIVNGSNIYAGSDLYGVFTSTNDGIPWILPTNDIMYQKVYALAKTGTKIFAGTHGGGVFMSTDNANSWTVINYGFPSSPPDVNSLFIYGTDIFAGTDIGVWKAPLAGLGVEEINNNESDIIVYPNPVLGNITIESPQKATIEILNINGQIIKIEKTKDNRTDINISDFASGIYIIQVQTENGVITKKFIKE